MKEETKYQRGLIKKIKDALPGCVVIKNDPRSRQGIPDILVLHRDTWGMLEVKAHESSPHQPNQDHYVDLFSNMSFASFVCPENEQEVLDALQQALGS